MGKTAKDYERDYTDPELRERLKEEIEASTKGGRPGTWSARKSQLLTLEYERHGGGYRHPGEKTDASATSTSGRTRSGRRATAPSAHAWARPRSATCRRPRGSA